MLLQSSPTPLAMTAALSCMKLFDMIFSIRAGEGNERSSCWVRISSARNVGSLVTVISVSTRTNWQPAVASRS